MSAHVLGDLCELVVDCKNRTPPEAPPGEGIAFAIGTPHVLDGRIRLQDAKPVTQETFDTWTARAIPRVGDVVLTREAPVGRVGRVEEGMRICLGQRTMLLRADSKRADARYLKYLLLSPEVQSTLHAHASGSTVAHLRVAQVRTLPIPSAPPLEAQRAIGDLLGALDDKIAVNERIAATAEDLCRAIFSEQSWEARTTVESIAILRKEQVAPQALSEPQVAHYSLPAFDSGAMPEMTDPRSIKSSKFVVRHPSVLLSKLNPDIPRVWNVSPHRKFTALASTEFLVLEPRNGVTTAELWAVLSQPQLLGDLASKVTGTSKSHQRVRPAEVMTSHVVDPRDLGDARGQARALVGRVMQARNESRKLADLRDTLLPQLMSGKLRVRDAEKIVEDAV
ncbi:restriction endonuclease subunit S [Streptomyces sp. NPDC005760]|uniref:restriction endonuclease subunit S n=1 Tax=Streptomyces sp. NPDC005760 TaxID=3156718 RepID=UPI0033CAC663